MWFHVLSEFPLLPECLLASRATESSPRHFSISGSGRMVVDGSKAPAEASRTTGGAENQIVYGWAVRTKPQAPRTLNCAI
jgi:hypothetical protein